ncbi:MAG: murein biosynthesis integral membrane protein MurJ, partial [Spirochaetales bacterium]
MSSVEKDANRRSAVSTAVVMACTLFSRILGFVRTATIGALFGAGGMADVINLVFNIPNNLRKLLAEGALSAAFIPELSRELTLEDSGKSAHKLARLILGLQALVILPFLALCLIFPSRMLGIFEQFSDPHKKALSVVFFRWMMPYLFFVSVSAVMMAVHNTHDRFFIPAITPIVFSISVISSLFVGHLLHKEALFIGIGVLAGGLAQILVQYPSYRKLGYRLLPVIDFQNPSFRRVLIRWAPMLVTSSLFAVNNQIAMLLASYLPDKSASALTYAVVFYQLPFGIFSASITTVLYPRMSRQAAEKNFEGLLGSLAFGYRNLWALLLPSAMGLILLGEPIISMAFQRRAFTAFDTRLTATVLTAYAAGMPFVGLFNITQRAFYAVGDVKRPFYCALFTVILDIGLSLSFVFGTDWGPSSLAWANSITFTAGGLIQFVILKRRMGFYQSRQTLVSFAKSAAGTAAGAVLIAAVFSITGRDWWLNGSYLGGFLLIIAIVLAAAA